tara:strand:- start:600 stop:1079 length:480 start_codon:yes stop_codon:yes gene_type:complete
MEKENVKKLFLDIAVAAISCDGDIDDREIDKLKEIEKNSPYFSEFDLSKPLNESLETSMKDLSAFQNILFESIKKANLDIVQQLSAIDISLEIIAADEKIENSEIDFVKNLRKNLDISDDVIFERFGQIDYLFLEENSDFNYSSKSPFENASSGTIKKK